MIQWAHNNGEGGAEMSIAGDLIRGHTDAIILFRLKNADSYGYEISKAVTNMTNGQFELKEATLYSAFRRLEQSGLIGSYWGEGDGARRRYYKITMSGKEACERFSDEWTETKATLDTLLDAKEK